MGPEKLLFFSMICDHLRWEWQRVQRVTRVPALMTWPGTLRPQLVNEPGRYAYSAQLSPLGRAPALGGVDGTDFAAVLEQSAAWPSENIFWDYDGQTAVRQAIGNTCPHTAMPWG